MLKPTITESGVTDVPNTSGYITHRWVTNKRKVFKHLSFICMCQLIYDNVPVCVGPQIAKNYEQ